MHYDGTIRIQSNIKTKYLKEMSKSMDHIKIQSRTNELANVLKNAIVPFSNLKLIETQDRKALAIYTKNNEKSSLVNGII